MKLLNWLLGIKSHQNDMPPKFIIDQDRYKIQQSELGISITTTKKHGIVDKENVYYLETIPKIKQLKREGKLEEAEDLLLRVIDACENESMKIGWSSPPGYYEDLAIVYRKMKRYEDEIKVLNRYFRFNSSLAKIGKRYKDKTKGKIGERLQKCYRMKLKRLSSHNK